METINLFDVIEIKENQQEDMYGNSRINHLTISKKI